MVTRHAVVALPHAADDRCAGECVRAAASPSPWRGDRCLPAIRKMSSWPGVSALGELLDERQQRQVLGIGEKEPAERPRRRRGARGARCARPARSQPTCARAAAAIALSQRSSASLKSANLVPSSFEPSSKAAGPWCESAAARARPGRRSRSRREGCGPASVRARAPADARAPAPPR